VPSASIDRRDSEMRLIYSCWAKGLLDKRNQGAKSHRLTKEDVVIDPVLVIMLGKMLSRSSSKDCCILQSLSCLLLIRWPIAHMRAPEERGFSKKS